MRSEYFQRFGSEDDEAFEKQRRDAMRTIEAHGKRAAAELPEMSEGERAKWFFWNLHENLEEFRKLEPTLIGQVMCTQLTVTDGLSMATEKVGMEKKIELILADAKGQPVTEPFEETTADEEEDARE